MNVSTILFDFDGTLADTLPVCFHAFRFVFRKHDDRELADEDFLDMFGPSEIGILEMNLRNRTRLDEAIEDYYREYERVHADLAPVNEEIRRMLDELGRRGSDSASLPARPGGATSFPSGSCSTKACSTFRLPATTSRIRSPIRKAFCGR